MLTDEQDARQVRRLVQRLKDLGRDGKAATLNSAVSGEDSCVNLCPA